MLGGVDSLEEQARPPEFVEALAKGLAVLGCFDSAHPDMTLSDIARRVELSPAAARRALITLITLGYVGQDGKRFHLRPKVMGLGSAFYAAARIDEVLAPELRHFVETYGDASSVATLDGADVIYIAHHSTQRARRSAAVVGARYPAHATSLGRVLLAALSPAALDRYFATAALEALTPKTVTDPRELRAIIAKVRDDGHATTVDQLDFGITALAVPIRDSAGRTIAALNSSGYSGEITADRLVTERLRDLRAAATRIAYSVARYPAIASAFAAME